MSAFASRMTVRRVCSERLIGARALPSPLGRRFCVFIVLLIGLPLVGRVFAQSGAPAGGAPTTAPAAALSPAELGRMAIELFRQNRTDEAYQAAEAALAKLPGQPQALLAKGEVLYSLKSYREALTPLSQYCSTPDGKADYRGFELLGDLYLRSNQNRLAMNFLDAALKNVPQRGVDRTIAPGIQIKLAKAQAELGMVKDAISNATEAVNIVPGTAQYHWDFANIYIKARDADNALAEMEKAVKLLDGELKELYEKVLTDPNEAGILDRVKLQGEIYEKIVRMQSIKLVEAKSAKAPLYIAIARSLARQAEVERLIRLYDSVRVLTNAAREDAKSVDLWLELADAQFRVGMRAAARSSTMKAAELDPTNPRVAALRKQLGDTGPLTPTTAPAQSSPLTPAPTTPTGPPAANMPGASTPPPATSAPSTGSGPPPPGSRGPAPFTTSGPAGS